MSQVQQLRQRFEQLKIPSQSIELVDKLQKTPPVAPVIKPKPLFGLFKRSKTSIEITRKATADELSQQQDKNDKDLLNKCLKRSPAFRFNQDRTRASIHSHPSARSSQNHNKKKVQTFDHISDEVEYLCHSETIKKALSKPLPVGLPPKKPPRVFSSASPSSENGRKSSISSTCSSSSTPNKDEVIYMQPFAHLKHSPSSSSSSSPPTKPKIEPEELHYMCTDLDTGRSRLTNNSSTRRSSLQAAHDSFEKSSIEKIDLLFDVIYDEKRCETVIGETNEILNEIDTKKSPKVSRSLTEKRKQYVRKVSDIRMKPRRSIDTELLLPLSKPSPPIVEYKPTVLINKFQSYIDSKKDVVANDSFDVNVNNSKLFDMLLLIGFDESKNSSYIKMCFPASAKPPSTIALLIYPNKRVIIDLVRKENQNFCLILTDEYGNQFYAYCRQLLPEGSDNCLPLAYCIVSKVKSTGFYFQILAEIESRHGQPEHQRMKLIQNLRDEVLPKNGETLQFFVDADKSLRLDPMLNRRQSVDGNEKILILRPTDPRQEYDEFSVLYESTSNKLLLTIVGSLLIERKVILVSNDLSKLSMAILAFTSILYPFEWQYPVISLISDNIIDLLESPFPILAGVLKSAVKNSDLKVEDGIVVDLDEREILQKCGDEETLIPPSLKKSILLSLKVIEAVRDKRKIMNVLIAEAFMKFFVKLFSRIDVKNFKKETFIRGQKNQSIEYFLDWFLDTAMFKLFLRKSQEENGSHFKVFNAKVLGKSATISHDQREKQLENALKNLKYSTTKRKTFTDKIKEFLL